MNKKDKIGLAGSIVFGAAVGFTALMLANMTPAQKPKVDFPAVEMPVIAPHSPAGWYWNKEGTRGLLVDENGSWLGGISNIHPGEFQVWVEHYHFNNYGGAKSRLGMGWMSTPHAVTSFDSLTKALAWFGGQERKHGQN